MTGLLDLLLPPSCAACGTHVASHVTPLLCSSCRNQLTSEAEVPACPGCGLWRPLAIPAETPCPTCRERRFRFHHVVALGGYAGPLRDAAIRMKRFDESPLTAAVGHLLAERLLRKLSDRPTLVVPVPKFWWKRLVRGVNTAELLASVVAKQLGVRSAPHALRCVRSTRKQSLLSIVERTENPVGAFRAARRQALRDADVLLIDDIMTTGATASEAAKILRRAGARRVTVAVAARAQAGRQPSALNPLAGPPPTINPHGSAHHDPQESVVDDDRR